MQDPLAYITQIDSAASQHRVVEFLHLAHPFVDDLLPCPGGAVSLIDERNRLHHERSIIQKFSMNAENSGLQGIKEVLGISTLCRHANGRTMFNAQLQ